MSKRKEVSTHDSQIATKKLKELNYCEKLHKLLEKKIIEQSLGLVKAIEDELTRIIEEPRYYNYEELFRGFITVRPNYKILEATFMTMNGGWIKRVTNSFGFTSVNMKYNRYDNEVTIIFGTKK